MFFSFSVMGWEIASQTMEHSPREIGWKRGFAVKGVEGNLFFVKIGSLHEQEIAQAYGTFLTSRDKDRLNIIWIIGGDIMGDEEYTGLVLLAG